MEKNPPREVLRDGNLKASIFRNEGEKGAFYSASLARSYKDQEGQVRDTHSFAGNELLRVSELARKAYDRTQELRREDRRDPDGRSAPDGERDQRREAFRQDRSANKAPDRRPAPQR